MTYNRTFKNCVYPLRALIYNAIAISIIAYYFSRSENDNFIIYLILFGGLFVIAIIVCLLHVDYFLKTKTVEIDTTSKFIAFDNYDRVDFNQIKEITLVIPPALYRKDPINASPFDNYHYARFITDDGKVYFFTCLLSQDVEREVIQIGIPLQIKKRIIAFTFF